jgi:EAL domain-containing protein (putative c-di-GMP-specific phosphodiesterase class I)
MAEDRLVFWAQPVVDPLSMIIDHHELLLRMELDGEIIAPALFLPHAEQSALINDIDRWAIRAGAEIAREMPVAINLSARSIGDPRLLDQIKDAVPDPRVARRVIFEITETAAASHLVEAHDLVAGLTELGCGVALDDFGTGYGSFTYLKHLPVTELKIDMEFVRGLVADTANQRIVRSLVDVAGNFGMRTVAEGVEDQPTLELLRTLGVDLVQGYHLGRPAPLGPEIKSAQPHRATKALPHVTTSA